MDEKCPQCDIFTGTVPLKQLWISCDVCGGWYHAHCLGLIPQDITRIQNYHCPQCTKSHGPSLWKRSSGRRRNKVDYRALDEGHVDEAIVVKEHPHIAQFELWEGEGGQVDELRGDELTVEYALKTRLPRPVKISNEDTEGLGLVIPEFDVDDVVEAMGDDTTLEVMDVLTQNGTRDKWSLSAWRDYFKSPEESRDRIYNVLSLEISESSLGQEIKRPEYVEQIDLVDKVWPESLDGKPVVQKYCLMGVKNSYTDFHLDFAGTSVYYTVVYGEKQFLFFPPTEHNLNKYVQWITNSELARQFLGNLGMEGGVKVLLKPGDVMIIPSGWIHAVYTPRDTLVIGGNFLTSFNIPEQLRIIDIELKTKVGNKFKFPHFNRLMHLTAWSITQGRTQIDERGLQELILYLKVSSERHDKGAPVKVVGNTKVLIRKLEQMINDTERSTKRLKHD